MEKLIAILEKPEFWINFKQELAFGACMMAIVAAFFFVWLYSGKRRLPKQSK